MDELIKNLLATKDLWLPALTFLLGQLSASRIGIGIEKGIKARLKWLKDPEAEKAFRSAFSTGIERFGKEQSQIPAASAVISVLTYVATHDVDGFDKAIILRQIFAHHPDSKALSKLVKKYAFALEVIIIPIEEVNASLLDLIENYLKPAFLENQFFAERVGFSEVIGLLEEILGAMAEPKPDLVSLLQDYKTKIAAKYEYVTMQGISPKVQNRTIGIRMEDVFIPLKVDINFDVQSGLPIDQMRFLIKRYKEISNKIKEELEKTGSVLENSLLNDMSFLFSDKIELYILSVAKSAELSDRSIKINVELRDDIESKSVINHFKSHSGKLLPSFDIGRLLILPRIVLMGDPGSGKTTLTRYISWAYSSDKFKNGGEGDSTRIPIRMRAIEFGDALNKGLVSSLEEYLLKDADRFSPLIKENLITGKTLILIDGIDEVGDVVLQLQVKEKIDDFIADPVFSDNHIIITTRIVGYEPSGITGQFPHFVLAELNDEQISGFVENWYRAIHSEMPSEINVEQERAQLLDAIKGNVSINRLARNPLLLTIIALIKWQGRLLPEQRVLLYDAAAQTLIRSWPLTQRHVEIDELFVREWLAPIALRIMENRTSDLIDEFSLMDELVKSMLRLKSMSEFDARRASKEMLNNITLHSGFLLPRGNDPDGRNLFGFFHQTFAEYLCAYYLAGRWEDGELNLIDYAHDPYWREVLLLMAGHLGTNRRAKAGQFINAIRNVNSSPYEDFLHRDLLLAARILGDGVPAGPGELIETLLSELLSLWQETRVDPLKQDIEEIVRYLKNTEYNSVIFRLATQMKLTGEQIISLARLFGAGNFKPYLSDLLTTEDENLRLDAAALLLGVGDKSGSDILVSLAEKTNEFFKESAGMALIRHGDARGVKPVLLGSHIVRFDPGDPLLILAKFSETYTGIKTELNRLLSDENSLIRLDVASILAKSDQKLATDTLVDLLDSDNHQLCFEAASQLAELNDQRGLEIIAQLLNDEDERICFQAGEYLTKRKDHQGTEALIRINKPYLRYRAAELLYKQDDPRGKEILLELLSSGDIHTRLSAARFLVEEGNLFGIQTLLDLLDSSDLQIVFKTAKFLAHIDEPQGLEALEKLLDSPDPELSYQVAEFLSQKNHPKSLTVLANLLKSNDPWLRYQASTALVACKDPSAHAILSSEMKNMMKDHEYKYGAARSLSAVAYQYLLDHLSPAGNLIQSSTSLTPNKKRKK